MSDAQALTFLRELEYADETLGATVAELGELAAEVESVRLRATELEELLARLPAKRNLLEVERAESELKAAHALRAKNWAEESLSDAERGRSEAAVAEARRSLVRTRDVLRMAARRTAELDQKVTRLEAVAADAVREAAVLEARSRQLAVAFREHPRLADRAASDPAPGLAGVVEWGSAARAALFVARGGLNSEREAVIRQANELGSVLLGEAVFAARPAMVRRRVERATSRS